MKVRVDTLHAESPVSTIPRGMGAVATTISPREFVPEYLTTPGCAEGGDADYNVVLAVSEWVQRVGLVVLFKVFVAVPEEGPEVVRGAVRVDTVLVIARGPYRDLGRLVPLGEASVPVFYVTSSPFCG